MNNKPTATYLILLNDSLKKKISLLDELILLTREQESLIKEGNVENERFKSIIDSKDEKINKINTLDQGFEQFYNKIKDEVLSNKELYYNEITSLQKLIKAVTARGVELEVIERHNKANIEVQLREKRKSLKNSITSNKNVSNYYKGVSTHIQSEFNFFDTRK